MVGLASIPILECDRTVLAVDKPKHVVSTDEHGDYRGPVLDQIVRSEFPHFQIAHRLDANTTGINIGARTPQAYAALKGAFRERKTEKVYLAVCVPNEVEPRVGDYFDINRRLYHDRNLRRTLVTLKGKDARTQAVVCSKSIDDKVLVMCRIHTGRTHQIRAHLAHVGLPVLNDRKYNSGQNAKGGHVLHASYLGYEHPEDGVFRRLLCPPQYCSRYGFPMSCTEALSLYFTSDKDLERVAKKIAA